MKCPAPKLAHRKAGETGANICSPVQNVSESGRGSPGPGSTLLVSLSFPHTFCKLAKAVWSSLLLLQNSMQAMVRQSVGDVSKHYQYMHIRGLLPSLCGHGFVRERLLSGRCLVAGDRPQACSPPLEGPAVDTLSKQVLTGVLGKGGKAKVLQPPTRGPARSAGEAACEAVQGVAVPMLPVVYGGNVDGFTRRDCCWLHLRAGLHVAKCVGQYACAQDRSYWRRYRCLF